MIFLVTMATLHGDAMRERTARFDYGGAFLHAVAALGYMYTALGADAVRRAVSR